MITEKELLLAQESYTKKDFYQIWSELVDIGSKLSERYKFNNTNESDPGVVLLKTAVSIADKLNYNIDKNILEAFLLSCTQYDSMKRLCELGGYDMKYYNSATTNLTFSLKDEAISKIVDSSVTIPAFTNIQDIDGTINYVLLKSAILTKNNPINDTENLAIEGTLQNCTNNTGERLITVLNLDDNYRYYLPESAVAENGIFIAYEDIVKDDKDTLDYISTWKKVSNLNSQRAGQPVWKFGFDSAKSLPYIQFPADISSIINDGLYIKYIRTSGLLGNVSNKVLAKIADSINVTIDDTTVDFASLIEVNNVAAALNGSNIETLDAAYNSYKKMAGTFDTLVTCRDYMNAIYNMYDELSGVPLVSNIQVSDIRDDINCAYILCTFDTFGMKYANKVSDTKVNNFDLLFYPFKSLGNVYDKDHYIKSFNYYTGTFNEINNSLADNKTISHEAKVWDDSSKIAAIKDFIKLKANITTTKKVNQTEEAAILKNVFTALYKNFNMRNVDWGEKIPEESILSCIENADTRIKNVNLYEVGSTLKIATVGGSDDDISTTTFKRNYNTLVAKNVLAGKAELFDYDNEFTHSYNEAAPASGIESIYPTDGKILKKIETKFSLPASLGTGYTLNANEIVQFKKKNYITKQTYGVYVNYFYSGTTISKNQVYELTSNDKLWLEYTDSNGDHQYEYYTDGDIICPSFELSSTGDNGTATVDGTKWTTTKPPKNADNTYKKFKVLSGTQQIELKATAAVTLPADNISGNLYYYVVLNDKSVTKLTDGYSLKDGEYFFYTDQNKRSIAYYGSGTQITFTGIPSGLDIKVDTSISLADILNNGITEWQTYPLNSSTKITFTEYEFTTLAEGDIIKSFEFKSASPETGWTWNKWREITSAKYKFAGDSTETDISGEYWIRTRYDLNVGPDLMQVLGANDLITVYQGTAESTDSGGIEISGTDIGFRCNYLLQEVGESIDTTWTYTLGDETQTIDDVKLNVFKYTVATKTTGTTPATLVTGNFNTNWTSEEVAENISIALNINIPTGNKGLIMFYTNNYDTDKTKHCYLEATGVEATGGVLTIVNNGGSWWNGYKITEQKYYLKAGVNVVEIPSGITKIEIKSAITNQIIFGNLKIVKLLNDTELKINPALFYDSTDSTKLATGSSDIDGILSIISTLDKDHAFYYNADLENSLALDINYAAGETMGSASTWYDYNNYCNKFVISEIDADSLKTGITLTNASRL